MSGTQYRPRLYCCHPGLKIAVSVGTKETDLGWQVDYNIHVGSVARHAKSIDALHILYCVIDSYVFNCFAKPNNTITTTISTAKLPQLDICSLWLGLV